MKYFGNIKNARRQLLVVVLLFLGITGLLVYIGIKNPVPPTKPGGGALSVINKADTKISVFSSENDFKEYLNKASSLGGYSSFSRDTMAPGVGNMLDTTELAIGSGKAAERMSSTNVQVSGVDEPDIVKTDGDHIYVSKQNYFGGVIPFEPELMIRSQESILPFPEANTSLVKAFPQNELSLSSEIDLSGDLFLYRDVLIVQTGNSLSGFSVSDKTKPESVWEIDFSDDSYILTSRLMNEKIYLVIQKYINHSRPCPFSLTTDSNFLTIPCNRIYHPTSPVAVDVTYSVMTIDPISGALDSTATFVGLSSMSTVMMNQSAIFVTYGYQESQFEFIRSFFKSEATDLVSNDFIRAIDTLSAYDISENSKMQELSLKLNSVFESYDDDAKKKLENDLINRGTNYMEKNKRAIERTGIVKIDAKDLSVDATGGVPGSILNQFSIDYHNDYLRLATTTNSNFFMFGQIESVNDIYIMDNNLDQVGSILDLGLGERIYSARFVGDKGYLVTFRQIDPFYVLDLADSNNPKMTGELKIPGFSSYLHPISDTLVLGVGQESQFNETGISDGVDASDLSIAIDSEPRFFGQSVKLSLFDVSDVTNPVETSKYLINENWTDISNSHHAFLIDTKHNVFFVPTPNAGYIFSYEGNEITLKMVVSDISPKRAVYINDYLYVIGDEKIVVVDEINWTRVNELEY